MTTLAASHATGRARSITTPVDRAGSSAALKRNHCDTRLGSWGFGCRGFKWPHTNEGDLQSSSALLLVYTQLENTTARPEAGHSHMPIGKRRPYSRVPY